MPNSKVAIVDYGIGNLFNVQRALELLGADAVISSKPADILAAERVVIPGVGAFAEGMKGLHERGLVGPIREFAGSGRPILGICLGAQLMLTHSEEHGTHEGLDLLKGIVVALREPAPGGENYKIPQIGWNSLNLPDYASSSLWDKTILRGIPEESEVYFLHTYINNLHDSRASIAVTEYGHDRFCSVFQSKNISGIQPHPERSGEVGLRILRNFLEQ